MVVHLITLLLPAVIVGTALWNYSFFSLHPICLSIAYCFLMPQGVFLFSPQSTLFPGAARSKKVTYHTYILLTMLAIIYLGQMVVYTVKESNGKSHFTTWHGLIGLITVLYTTIQVLAGVFVKYASIFKLPKSLKLADLKLYHGISGCALLVLSCITVALGLSSTWFISSCKDYVREGCYVAIAVLGLCVLNYCSTLISSRTGRKG